MSDRPTLILIDGSSYIFRAYHAIPHLSTSKGVPTNAVYGFTLMLLKAIKDANPTHLAIAFDKEARTYRQQIDPNYKANRPPPPGDLVPQFSMIRDVVKALNIPVLEYAGFEADDVIATLAKQAVAAGFHVFIITGDKDFMQLVNEHVELFDSMSDKHTTVPTVSEKLGVRPDQVVDYMSLIGDEIDNIPGIPSVGPKTASQLIQHFGTVEKLLENPEAVNDTGIRGAKKLAGLIKDNAEQIAKNKKLVVLRDDLELGVKPDELDRKPMHEAEVRKLFQDLEFTRLLRDLPPPPPTSMPTTVTTVLTADALEALAQMLEKADAIALRVITEGLKPRVDPVIGLAFALGGQDVFYVPFAHRYLGAPRQLDPKVVAERLRPILEDAKRPKYGHDMKSDYLALKQLGVTLAGLACDVELASYLLNSARREHALADLARERLSCELPLDLRGNKKRPVADVPVEEAALNLGACTAAVFELAKNLLPQLTDSKLLPLFADLELPLLPILAEMELRGITVDRDVLSKISQEVDGLVREKEEAVYAHAGRHFNINSNAQLATVLFEDLKLPVIRKTKTGASTDQEVLEKLAEQHPLPRAILEYRTLFKLKGTYLDTLPTLVERDGRIHTSFHQATAATGRLASVDPNLQNIPVRTDIGRRIREAFVAKEGWSLISADYSQIELRVLAHVSGDEALMDSFARNEDVHTRTAAEVFGVSTDLVTHDMRRAAKAINFGIAYGLTSFGLSQRLDLPGKEAQAIIDRYFVRYAGVRRWLDQTIEQARRDNEVTTLFGRRRFIPDIHSRNPAARSGAERIAVNTPIQGTAADLIKRAMIEVDRRLAAEKLQARLLLQVHDELLLEAPAEELERAKTLTVEAMKGAGELRVPLLVEVGAGKSWAEAH